MSGRLTSAYTNVENKTCNLSMTANKISHLTSFCQFADSRITEQVNILVFLLIVAAHGEASPSLIYPGGMYVVLSDTSA